MIKLHGDIDRPDSIVLTQSDYGSQKFGNEALRIFLTGVFTTKTVLFVGYSLSDPDLLLLLEHLQFVTNQESMPHYALMRTKAIGRLVREKFRRLYGIQIIGDADRDDHPDIAGFLRELAASTRKQPRRPAPPAAAGRRSRPATAQTDVGEAGIQRLLEAMGHRIVDARAPFFLSQYRAGEQWRQVVTRYTAHPPTKRDLEILAEAIKRYGVFEGLLLSDGEVSNNVQRLAEDQGIRAYPRDRYVDRLANFEDYLGSLHRAYEVSGVEPHYVPLKVCPEVPPADDDTETRLSEAVDLDAYVDAWLADRHRNHLSILGDFGTGKTWFCLRLADRIARSRQRIPILISLRDYSRAYDIEQMLTDALVNRFRVALPGGFKTLQYLNEEGRLLLIFDGFDEMERRVSDYRSATENFWQIVKVVTPRSKVILTCRTAFLRHGKDELVLMHARSTPARIVVANESIELGRNRTTFEIVHLQDFDEAQIREAVRRRKPETFNELTERIGRLPNLRDMAQRPVLLDMIMRTMDTISDPSALNMSTLYESYTEDLLKARISTEVPPISPEERRFFLEELAWEMQRTRRSSVPFSEFPERVTRHFGLADSPEKVAFFERDIRTQSYLIRNQSGEYRFAHKSMMEYFVSRRLARLPKDWQLPQVAECPLTNAIITFLHHLVTRGHRYERRARDEMMLVPAGTFVLGWEEQANLSFATVQLPFWIDRFPVTNEAYCVFLNGRGQDERGWVDLDNSAIRQEKAGCAVVPGFERHPVTGVSWWGARAYAMWAGKRLPTEQEWELAARGIDGRRFPWGEYFSTALCNTRRSGLRQTTPVGQYGEPARSPYGCQDMAGNVWEWTETSWADCRVTRGGSFADDPMRAVCAYRGRELPDTTTMNLGFRCAITALESANVGGTGEL